MHTLMGAWFVVISLVSGDVHKPWDIIGPYHSEKECMAARHDMVLHDETGVQQFDCASGDGPAGTSYWTVNK